MDKTLSNLLGSNTLPPELMDSLQEAFDKKVAEAKEQAEVAIRSEFAARFERDKAALVEAMDLMLSDVAKKFEDEKAAEVGKLKEAREKFEGAVSESQTTYKKKIKEHVGESKKFVTEQLSKKIAELNEEKKSLAETRSRLRESFRDSKKQMQREYAERIKKIDEFVAKNLTREIEELKEDHDALIKARFKVISEGKKKIADLQSRFVKEAAKKVEAVISETLAGELKQLHEDIERNRQNSFGRRIFEAVAAEFMTSHFSEGSEVRKLSKVLEAKKAKINKLEEALAEKAKLAEAADRKLRIAEDRSKRTRIMNELLSNLRGENRQLMESMLETVKTDNLKSSFEKLLPVVLKEGGKKMPDKKKMLAEKPVKRLVTGDRSHRLVESAEDSEIEANIQQVLRLAGLNK